MKFLSVLLVCIAFMFSAGAQSVFSPKPLPVEKMSIKAGAAIASPVTQNFFRPIVGVSASVSNGTQLAGGFGFSFQHDYLDVASNTWAIRYEISALGFLGVGQGKISGTGGIVFGIPGTNGLIQIGPGYDFTNKQVVLLTGTAINF